MEIDTLLKKYYQAKGKTFNPDGATELLTQEELLYMINYDWLNRRVKIDPKTDKVMISLKNELQKRRDETLKNILK